MNSTPPKTIPPRLFCKPVAIPYDDEILYETELPASGDTLQFRSLQLSTDLDLLHDWVNRPYARRFWQLNGDRALLERTYTALINNPRAHSNIGVYHGVPACQVDLYLVATDELGLHVDAEPDDCGLHFLMGPVHRAQKGLTVSLLRAFLGFYFSFGVAERIYAEPDQQNDLANLLARKAGFQYLHPITLSYKTANPYTISKTDFYAPH